MVRLALLLLHLTLLVVLLRRAALPRLRGARVPHVRNTVILRVRVQHLLASVHIAASLRRHHLPAGNGLPFRGRLLLLLLFATARVVDDRLLLRRVAHGLLVLFLYPSDAVGAALLLRYQRFAGFGVMAVLDRGDGAGVELRVVRARGAVGDVEDCEGGQDGEEEGRFEAARGRHCDIVM